MPYDVVLKEIQSFIENNPSEVIFLLLRSDYSPINADNPCLRRKTKVNKTKDMNPVVDYTIDKLGRSLFANEFTRFTKIKDLVEKN